MLFNLPFTAILLITIIDSVYSIKCYQCSSEEDPEGKDLCGAFAPFDKTKHTPVDCLQDQANTPGIYCLKVVNQPPRSFIGDNRWRTVIRRCASASETGATNVCNFGYLENKVYWEQCYCTSDSCNGSSRILLSSISLLGVIALIFFSYDFFSLYSYC